MVSSPKINKSALDRLNLKVLPVATKNAFLKCIKLPFFAKNDWYLAGGTALALQAGNRRSYDLDFFTSKKSFDEREVEEIFSQAGTWKTSSVDRGTVYGELDGAKISLIAYPFVRFSQPFFKVGTVSLVSPADIAVMKITAISQRGKKRDFYDLYWLSLNTQPLIQSIEAVNSQYKISQNLNHILKSLVYFADAEADPEPEIYFDADWPQVKEFFEQEVLSIAKKLILQ